MIFITVGTHEQPFDRLLKWIDELIEEKIIKEDIVCQKGFTDYEPKNYKASKLLPYDDMNKYTKEARIVITHGGPASFIAPLSIGKIPIVVPRKTELNEHVNNHQLDFCKQVEKRMGNIFVVETKEELIDAIKNYSNKLKNSKKNISSNNSQFCKDFADVVSSII
jgi:UDP-N-acetylglucosamine transferase subunit ALG13